MAEDISIDELKSSSAELNSGFVEAAEQQNLLKKVLGGFKWFFTHRNFLYALRRLITGLFTLVLVAGAVFLLLRLVPKEGYYDLGAMQKMSKLQKVAYKQSVDKKYGFDKPIIQQLGSFYWDILPIPRKYATAYEYTDLTFTEQRVSEWTTYLIYLGESATTDPGKLVSETLKERIPISFRISIIATIITYLCAYPLGVYMARRKDKAADKIGNAFIVLNLAIPGLVFYLLLNSLGRSISVAEGVNFGVYDSSHPVATVIPAIFAISFLGIPGVAMWVRRFMVDEGDADYVKFARSKGLSENKIMYTHVLRNAIVPLVRNFPAAFVGAIVGSYFVEKIWNIPGTGILLITAMNPTSPDNVVVQSLTIIYAAISMVSYILGDIATVLVDPRIKLTNK